MEHVTDDCTCEGKKCTKCKYVLCVGNYTKDKRLKSGLRSKCKTCGNLEYKAWREANPEYCVQRVLAWQHANLDHYNRTRKQAREKKPEVYKEQDKRHYRKYRSKRIEKAMQYCKSHPHQHTAARHRRRSLKTQAGGSYTVVEWEELKAKYNYACLCCGRKEPEIKLTADHIIPIVKQGTSNIVNIQPLCLPCNASKGVKIIDYRKLVPKPLDN